MSLNINLGSRLNAIYELVTQTQKNDPYSAIWDCCCDHGHLGIKILNNDICEKVVFVDQLPHLIEQLSLKIDIFDKNRFEAIVADVGELYFNVEQRHLVMIAGVGGEATVEMINAIKSKNPMAEIDYIFCPSASHRNLREYLIDHEFGLVFETIVVDKKHCYEIIFVKEKAKENSLHNLTLVNMQWDHSNIYHDTCRNKILLHEKNKKLNLDSLSFK